MLDKIKKMKLDLSSLGLEWSSEGGYFCTPVGARVFARAGVDGIHYCTVKNHGETVFAVMPANEPGKYVLPIAKSFEDLLSVLLSLGDMGYFESALFCTREVFEARLQPPTEEQRALLAELAEKFALKPVADPYAYVRGLLAEFDPKSIKFGTDYAEWVPVEPEMPAQWKVCWNCGFSGETVGRAGTEIKINAAAEDDGLIWRVPAVYACGSGLVVDLLCEIEPEKYLRFYSKYKALEAQNLSEARREELSAENPMAMDFSLTAWINRRECRQKYAYGEGYIPEGLIEDAPREIYGQWVLEHYGLDKSKCWAMRRVGIPWATAKKPKLDSLGLVISFEPVTKTAGTYIFEAGDRTEIKNPATGEKHILKVSDIEAARARGFWGEGVEYPENYTVISYSLEPESREFHLTDAAPGDRPRRGAPEPFAPSPADDACIGIIGGADGPTAILFGGGTSGGTVRRAVSNLSFEPRPRIEWQASFSCRLKNDIVILPVGKI